MAHYDCLYCGRYQCTRCGEEQIAKFLKEQRTGNKTPYKPRVRPKVKYEER